MHRTLKLTGDAAKISTPGKKQIYRIHTENGTKPEGDYITRFDEDPRDQSELFMFHPQFTYINKTVRNFTARPLLHDIFIDGKLVYELPTIQEIKDYSTQSLSEFYEEYRRVLNPEKYPVDLSQKLYDDKMEAIHMYRDLAEKPSSRKVFE